MPVNWKSYESMVRLVSAIVAAHPELKLNYAGEQLFHYFIHLVGYLHFRVLFLVLYHIILALEPDYGATEVAKYHGGDCTYKAVWGVMNNYKRNSDALRKAYDDGIDPITVVLKEGTCAVAPPRTKTGPIFCLRHFCISIPPCTSPEHLLSSP